MNVNQKVLEFMVWSVLDMVWPTIQVVGLGLGILFLLWLI